MKSQVKKIPSSDAEPALITMQFTISPRFALRCAQFAANVRNKNVLRVPRKSGLPLNDAAPLA